MEISSQKSSLHRNLPSMETFSTWKSSLHGNLPYMEFFPSQKSSLESSLYGNLLFMEIFPSWKPSLHRILLFTRISLHGNLLSMEIFNSWKSSLHRIPPHQGAGADNSMMSIPGQPFQCSRLHCGMNWSHSPGPFPSPQKSHWENAWRELGSSRE